MKQQNLLITGANASFPRSNLLHCVILFSTNKFSGYIGNSGGPPVATTAYNAIK
jgi:hypothetical protein